MKKLVLFLFLLCVGFGIGFEAARWNPFRQQREGEAGKILGNGFQPTKFPLENRSFTIVVCGYNNGANVQKTLESIFSQNYEKFRVIYIDDASNDGSFELARDLIYGSEKLAEITLVRNEERLGDLANLVRAVQVCPDEEIIAVVDGKDWLAHEWVLSELNRYYANPDLWLTYGQSVDYPSLSEGISRPFRQKDLEGGFRNHPFIASHLKTFYAALFKKIPEADFIFQGSHLPAAAEWAYMIPMLEMAEEHFQFIPEVMYICNQQVPSTEDRELQVRCERFIRSLNPRESLSSLPLKTPSEGEI